MARLVNVYQERCIKDKFHEAAKKSAEEGNKRDVYTFQMIQALRDMAEMDVYPDGNFSDMDCNVWSMFHCFQRVEES